MALGVTKKTLTLAATLTIALVLSAAAIAETIACGSTGPARSYTGEAIRTGDTTAEAEAAAKIALDIKIAIWALSTYSDRCAPCPAPNQGENCERFIDYLTAINYVTVPNADDGFTCTASYNGDIKIRCAEDC